MNEFQEKYKSFDNNQLLKIVEEAENYQPLAVEAAKLELSSRAISEAEIQAVKTEISGKKALVEERQKQIKKVEDKAKAMGAELLDTVSPIQKAPRTIDKKINLIVIVFALLAVYQLVKELGLISSILSNGVIHWDLSTLAYFLPLILLPIAAFLFWKRNTIGWILMCAFFVFNMVNSLAILSIAWRMNRDYDTSEDDSSGSLIITHEAQDFFPAPDPLVYIMTFLVFAGSLWVISRNEFREVFRIDNTIALTTIGVSIVVTSFLIGLV